MNAIIIDKHEIQPGENRLIDIQVSKLPSGNFINIKAHVIRAKNPGPTVLLLGGVHGNEINGIEIVRRLVYGSQLDNINAGTVIAIPLLNVFGFISFMRDVPDGKDVNRSFPGSSSGSLAGRVAATLTKKILPIVDYALDFHTGGGARYNYPQIRYSKRDEKAFELAKVFSPPYIIQKPTISGSFRKLANELDIPVLVYEAGESTRLCGHSIQYGYDGTLRVLHELGVLRDYLLPTAKSKPLHVLKTGWLRASKAGMFCWSRSSGHWVGKGEKMGHIASPQGDRFYRVSAKKNAHIIGHNNASVVHVGDALFHLAYDYA